MRPQSSALGDCTGTGFFTAGKYFNFKFKLHLGQSADNVKCERVWAVEPFAFAVGGCSPETYFFFSSHRFCKCFLKDSLMTFNFPENFFTLTWYKLQNWENSYITFLLFCRFKANPETYRGISFANLSACRASRGTNRQMLPISIGPPRRDQLRPSP